MLVTIGLTLYLNLILSVLEIISNSMKQVTLMCWLSNLVDMALVTW